MKYLITISVMLSMTSAALGGGHRLLLVVNPLDENALRIAAAYQQLRQIPDANILMIEPPVVRGRHIFQITQEQFADLYARPIEAHIAAHDLAEQIDFIAMIGQPWRVKNAGTPLSMTQAIREIPQIADNPHYAAYEQPSVLFDVPALLKGDPVSSIHRRLSYTSASEPGDRHHYVGGLLSHTGALGISADDSIAALARAASSDGTAPAGTVYFEANSDIRSRMREPQWPDAQAALDRLGVSWVESRDTPGFAPKDRPDVRGAIVGRAEFALPNGSTYLPGSWADHVTSFGGDLEVVGHTKGLQWLKAGAAASSGTVREPRANPARFPHSAIHAFIGLGLTHGEAFAKSVESPILLQFFGDPLARPYARLPRIDVREGPDNAAMVQGQVRIVSVADHPDADAPGIREQQLYIDGKLSQRVPGPLAEFTIDTRALSDGRHELRIVAVNDNSIAAEAAVIRHITVNHHGRAISAAVEHATGNGENLAVPLRIENAGEPATAELHHLGRSVGTYDPENAAATVDWMRLPFGESLVTPVLVFADGTQTRGEPFIMERQPQYMTGHEVPPEAGRMPGAQVRYYAGAGHREIEQVDFARQPDVTMRAPAINLSTAPLSEKERRSFLPHSPTPHPFESVDRLAVQVEASILVKESERGEHLFWLYRTNDAARLLINGREVLKYSGARHGGSWGDLGGVEEQSIKLFLAPGRYDLRVEASNLVEPEGRFTDYFDVSLWHRPPHGDARLVDESACFTIGESP